MKIKLVKEMDSLMWDFYKTVTIYVNGNVAGYIAIEKGLKGEGYIEYVEIFDKYKGKGYYNMLLISCFTMFGIIDLHSGNRNKNSNPIYQYWTQNKDLGNKDDVRISMNKGKLSFNN